MNTDKQKFSDEFLNAFVDEQLDVPEKSLVYETIGRDPALNQQICELRKLRDMVQLAYRDVPAPPERIAPAGMRRRRLRAGVAAAFVLAVGIVLGIQLRPASLSSPPLAGRAETRPAAVAVRVAAPAPKPATPAAPAVTARAPKPAAAAPAVQAAAAAETPAPATIAAAAVEAGEPVPVESPRSINDVTIGDVRNKVLLHIANDDPARLAQALEEIEGLMRYYRDSRQSAHVEVVVNGRGLELVRIDTSAFAARIAKLQREYDNLTFAACQNTIDRLKREQGITARLLPGVVVTDSGMAEIMRRQIQGWTYVQV